ncbi:MAG: VWA domain-containing protein [Acidobacteriaceae bacterium]
MRSPHTTSTILLTVALLAPHLHAQTSTFHLNVAVDEVVLTFHAADARGLPVNDLKLSDLTLLDNGNPPARILDFQLQQNFPIRAGILIDTSGSMSPHLFHDQTIATQYAMHLFRQQTDQAFVTNFDRATHLIQPWTSNTTALATALQTTPHNDPIGGTALFDALYAACRYQFGAIDHRTSGNFILLFSDGEDNASFLDLETAVDTCQHTNTAIYAFNSNPHDGSFHPGTATLAQLAAQTGGTVFHDDASPADIFIDLRIIEASLRNQYRLVFRPAALVHDGAFHTLTLETPDRVSTLTIRSGYYAPKPARSTPTLPTPAPSSPDR